MVQVIISSLRAKITFTSIVKASLFVDYFSQFMDKTENKELNNFFEQSLSSRAYNPKEETVMQVLHKFWNFRDDKILLFESGHLKSLDRFIRVSKDQEIILLADKLWPFRRISTIFKKGFNLIIWDHFSAESSPFLRRLFLCSALQAPIWWPGLLVWWWYRQ